MQTARSSRRPAQVPNAIVSVTQHWFCTTRIPFPNTMKPSRHPPATLFFPIPDTVLSCSLPIVLCRIALGGHAHHEGWSIILFPSNWGEEQWHKQQAALKVTDVSFEPQGKLKLGSNSILSDHFSFLGLTSINVIASGYYIMYVFHEWLQNQEVWNTFCVHFCTYKTTIQEKNSLDKKRKSEAL